MQHREPRNRRVATCVCTLVMSVSLAACGSDEPPATAAAPTPAATSVTATPASRATTPMAAPQIPAGEKFWNALSMFCDQAFEGALTIGTEPSDRDIGEAILIMHVAECEEDLIRIPFHVSENRSRTWELRRDGEALELRHRHRHDDGSLDDITNYGGAACGGDDVRQTFCADAHTAEMIPTAKTNVWALEIHPGEMFAYELQREAEGRYFRVEFDLTQSVELPPPPW